MNNNDILRALRHALDINNAACLKLFSQHPHSTVVIGSKQLQALFLKEDEEGFTAMGDDQLIALLDGLIATNRGVREDTPPPKIERLTRNEILKKLRIAFEFKEQEMLATLAAGGSKLSKSELSAFFRKATHKHYRPVGNQIMRAFFRGLAKAKTNPTTD